MPGRVVKAGNVQGLSETEIPALQAKYGTNSFQAQPGRRLLQIIWDIVKEPMFLLLLVACSLYFILGSGSEGFMMLAAMVLVAAISLYQEVRSVNAVKALQQLTQPMITVIRDGKERIIASEELVPGDVFELEEGQNVPADALIVEQNDFSVNESIITGESLPAYKDESDLKSALYQGTTVNSGKAIARVTQTGNTTVLGKLGTEVGAYHPAKTLLQQQLHHFLRFFTLFGLAGFFIIFFMNFRAHGEWTTSLLFALTLAMSAIPEEIPVAFSSFMALGAFKMSKLGIISRQPQVVESLGAVSVFCFDKTGTITENRMQLKYMYEPVEGLRIELTGDRLSKGQDLLRFGVLASEMEPFDAMEKAIWEAYRTTMDPESSLPSDKIYEYPLEGRLPMMTHVYSGNGKVIVAGKGAPERIAAVCKLDASMRARMDEQVKFFASKGFRVIGVASAVAPGETMPKLQDDFEWKFEGLLGLYDPPKDNVAAVLNKFHGGGITVKLITGDYRETAMNIAGQVGIREPLKSIDGEQVMQLSADELKRVVMETNVFARMFPDAKLKVIDALKENGEIVAMTGDGVNDGPAMKSANIGIAMGQKGTAIARQAADLILTDDNLERLVVAVSEGRKIFNNLKKAIRYIISIHIPIVLVASLPLLFGWLYPNIFTPVHIIFMELIMGPTCSIFFEREPMEKDVMSQRPRLRTGGIFLNSEIVLSVVQGIIIGAGVLFLYHHFMNADAGIETTRTVVFDTLILANVFLTFVNRSFSRTIIHTSRVKNNLVPVILIVSIIFLSALHFIPAIRSLFRLTPVSVREFGLSFLVAFVSVMWFEIYIAFTHPKATKRR